jgi:hypothetical protein
VAACSGSAISPFRHFVTVYIISCNKSAIINIYSTQFRSSSSVFLGEVEVPQRCAGEDLKAVNLKFSLV